MAATTMTQFDMASLLPPALARGQSLCIVRDTPAGHMEEQSLVQAARKTTRTAPPSRGIARAKSSDASRDCEPARPYSSRRAQRDGQPRRTRRTRRVTFDPTTEADAKLSPASVASRWSSVGAEPINPAAPQRRADRLNSNARSQMLHKLAASSNTKACPPSKPTRKFLDDDSAKAFHSMDMSLTQCFVHNKAAAANAAGGRKSLRSLRRPAGDQQSEQTRRNIVSILDSALGSLDLEDY